MWSFLKRLAGMFRALRSDLQAATAKYLVERQVIEVLKLTHAQEMLTYPRNEWPQIRNKQVEEIRAVSAGKPFDIVDRRSWAFPFLPECHDDITEVLTKRGWIQWPSVLKSDLLATRTEDGILEYHPPRKLIRSRYVGKMMHFTGKSVNALVTPNHKMLGRRALNAWGTYGRTELLEAGEICKLPYVTGGPLPFRTPGTSKWVGRLPRKDGRISIIPPSDFERRPSCTYIDYELDLKDWVAFLGIWLAEGSATGTFYGVNKASKNPSPIYLQVLAASADTELDDRHCGVFVSQKKGRKSYNEIKKLLSRLPWEFEEYEDGFNVYDRTLHSVLCSLGNQYVRYVPDWVKDLPPEYLSVLVKWMMIGDGSPHPDNPKKFFYYTTSRRLADDLQEVWQKIGYCASVGLDNRTCRPAPHSTRDEKAPVFIVANRARKFTSIGIPREVHYDGYVYCAEVPNHTLLTRRCGKAMWTGNSLHRL